jgi:hypothetical protein
MPRLRPALLILALLTVGFVSAPGLRAAGGGGSPADNPFLTLTNPKSWDARRLIRILPADSVQRDASGNRQTISDRIVLRELTIVTSMIDGCATATTDPNLATMAALEVDNTPIVTEPTIVPGLPNGDQLARWEAHSIDTRLLSIDIVGPATTYESVKVDEQAATRVPWPVNGYPAEIATSLAPQRFVESDDPGVVRLMNRWTSNNPHGPTPYLVAKALAGQVQEGFQLSGSASRAGYLSRYAGVNLLGAAKVAKSMKGTEADMAALLCSVYRAAGLPARVVVGLDIAGSPGGRANVPAANAVCRANFDPNTIQHALLRTWVEFYLYDEASNRGGWIPVDIVMLRHTSSRMQSLDRVWDGFGGGMCYDHLIPVTFHFVPPTTIEADAPPAFWGWSTTPAPPATNVELVIEAAPSVKRGGRR